MVSLRNRAFAVQVVFAAIVVVAALAVLSDGTLLRFVQDIAAGGAVDTVDANQIDARQLLMGRVQLGMRVLGAITFLTWFHRAHKNLSAGGLRGLTYSPGWAVGGFFVPVLGLVRPFQVMAEVSKGSSHLAGTSGVPRWQEAREGPLVGTWWGLFMVASVVGALATRIAGPRDGISAFVTAAWMALASDVLDIPAAIAAVFLVRQVTRLQEEARTHAVASVFD